MYLQNYELSATEKHIEARNPSVFIIWEFRYKRQTAFSQRKGVPAPHMQASGRTYDDMELDPIEK